MVSTVWASISVSYAVVVGRNRDGTKTPVRRACIGSIRRLCVASLVGSTLVGSWRLAQNLADFNRLVRRWLRSVGAELGWSSPLSPTRQSRYAPWRTGKANAHVDEGTCGRATGQ